MMDFLTFEDKLKDIYGPKWQDLWEDSSLIGLYKAYLMELLQADQYKGEYSYDMEEFFHAYIGT